MDIGKIRAEIEKEERIADKKTGDLIKQSDILTKNLRELKRLDNQYRTIEFRLDPGAEKRKAKILWAGKSVSKNIERSCLNIVVQIKKVNSLLEQTRKKIEILSKNV